MVTPEPSLEGHAGVNQAAPLGEGVSEREQSWTQDPELRPKTPAWRWQLVQQEESGALRSGVGISLGLTFSPSSRRQVGP